MIRYCLKIKNLSRTKTESFWFWDYKLKILFIGLLFFVPTISSAAVLSKPPNNLGLVGYWSFNEGSGTQAGDASGNGNNGILQNMESTDWMAGKYGKGLDFDGNNENISLGNPSELQLENGPITISVWALSRERGNSMITKGTSRGAVGTRSFDIFDTGSKIRWHGIGTTQISWAADGVLTTLNEWHHYVATWDGTTDTNAAKLYIDGAFAAQDTPVEAPLHSGDDWYIAANDGSSWHWNGEIDDVRIYNRTLSASEVKALYQSGAVKVGASSADLDNGSTLENGLVGLWTFDGKDTNWRANTAADLSGNGNTGTLTNMSTTTSPTDGKVGQALLFDGSNDFINMGNNSNLKPTSATSIAAWVKIDTPPGDGITKAIVQTGVNGSTGFSLVGRGSGTTDVGYWFYIDSVKSATPFFTVDGDWDYLVGVWDGSNIYLYLNGSEIDSDPQNTLTYSTENVYIGRNNYSHYFNGLIDEVRIYNRALSASEVKQLYNLGQDKINSSQNVTGGSLDDGLVGLWSFNGKDVDWRSNTAYDRAGGNNGIITNMSTTTSPTDGKIGQALLFDGEDDYVALPAGLEIPLGEIDFEGSFSFWGKGPAEYIAINRTASEQGDYAYIAATSTFAYINCDLDSSPWCTYLVSGTSFDPTTWNHFVFTGDGSSNYQLAVNGEITNINHVFNVLPGGDYRQIYINFVHNYTWSDIFFTGSVDELRYYNRALTPTEIKQLYDMGR